MGDRYRLTWIDKQAESGPVFQIGRDVYEREVPGGRLIRLRARESYPARVAPTAIEAFRECARAWGAPIVFIIDPNLKKPPAVRFLFEWSRSTHAEGTVERCYMKTGNVVEYLMGKLVLRAFTDGSMPFEAVEGESALQARLNHLDLAAPQEGFGLHDETTALARMSDTPDSLMASLLGRVFRRARRVVKR